jgi:glutathione S-transferase
MPRGGDTASSTHVHTPEAADRSRARRARLERQLHTLGDRLRAQHALGHAYLGGARISALDIYCATFLTPLSAISAEDCPQLEPALRLAFGSAHDELGALIPAELAAHRRMILERHLAWPIAL